MMKATIRRFAAICALISATTGHGQGPVPPFFVAGLFALPVQAAQNTEISRWEHEARNVTIVRDEWGIAHVHGKTDGDAVFGME